MAGVTLENVTKKFGNVVAVNNANLEIKDKEFLVLVGPSGCGKSTTLRMVAGLEEITSGDIYIGDVLVNDIPPKDRDIAMVFQNYALYPHMDVYNNMAFGLKLRKFPKEQIDARVKDAARILGIENLLDRKPKALSGGQRQRVAVGRAIVREPKVFLMDEPLSNLDAKLRVQMRSELSKLHNRLQTTIIYVTHDQTEAMTMGDRIVVMKDGFIKQVGAPLEIYQYPENMFVAGFIGSPAMNFIPGVLRKEGGDYVMDCESFRIRVPEKRFKDIDKYVDERMVLGVRPENIQDADFVEDAPADRVVKCMVDVVEPMGAEAYLYLVTGPHSFVARVNPRTTARDGEPHTVVLNMEECHLFDAKTENALLIR
ncbi:MAG: sn-glycerol-3-phosphate ABC transporter ATP-binding protein UgpC [Firmicutes bacterium]|jgi:multiple sugar transport system ATP-binding protein|nr:sn-glycerol-3-phosphate ABC transporter ATP-binding protein UgpC [Bacillota bacterium]MDD4336542.1 sn-glycerol-3-phosphate ABC transporter ATP-binding protein UgpC [Bacillota bacterium]MDD4791718.1 sn-glycerol-3-phosphate ABC transporter ATP-binding protein UgpC [Bacillota bacterium]